MGNIKYPEFLNTIEKYNECVRNTLIVKQFEDVFHKLLDDDTIPMLDCIKIMAKLEHDTIEVHGNKDLSCIIDMAEAIINYHYTTSKEKFLAHKKMKINLKIKTMHQNLRKQKDILNLTLELDIILVKNNKTFHLPS